MQRETPVEVKHFVAGLLDDSDGPHHHEPRGLTPAAVSALVAGDINNFAVATLPGGIEAQEARGQRDLCISSAMLPKDGTGGSNRQTFESLGIKFGNDVDDIFVKVELPQGWRIAPTEHSMHSDLIDAQGRKRAGIFYKAAFYDRSAHVSLCHRYSCGYRPIGGDGECREKKAFEGYVSDYTGDLFVTSPTAVEPEFKHDAPEAWREWMSTRDAKYDEAKAWLTAKFPEHENPLAYWD